MTGQAESASYLAWERKQLHTTNLNPPTSPLSDIAISTPETIGIRRTIRGRTKVLWILRQFHQSAIPTTIQGARKRVDALRLDTEISSLYMVLRARARPVVCVRGVRWWALAKWFRRIGPLKVAA